MRRSVPLLVLPLVGCAMFEPAVPPPQEIVLRVEADPGKPIKGADLFFSGQKIATTDDSGMGKLRLTGKDGETFDVVVKCPEGFTSPSRPVSVVLRRLADGKRPEYAALCPPTTRLVVVAVRAEGGPNLPVMYLGREVARTDTSGAAHVLLRLRPDEQFDLVIDTTEKGNERLRPQNPQNAFFVKQKDDVFTFDQKFTLEPIRRVPVKGRPPPKRI
jgi:hypothetical protein